MTAVAFLIISLAMLSLTKGLDCPMAPTVGPAPPWTWKCLTPAEGPLSLLLARASLSAILSPPSCPGVGGCLCTRCTTLPSKEYSDSFFSSLRTRPQKISLCLSAWMPTVLLICSLNSLTVFSWSTLSNWWFWESRVFTVMVHIPTFIFRFLLGKLVSQGPTMYRGEQRKVVNQVPTM